MWTGNSVDEKRGRQDLEHGVKHRRIEKWQRDVHLIAFPVVLLTLHFVLEPRISYHNNKYQVRINDVVNWFQQAGLKDRSLQKNTVLRKSNVSWDCCDGRMGLSGVSL